MTTLPADVRPAKIAGASPIMNSPARQRALIVGVAMAALSLSAPALAAKAPVGVNKRAAWLAPATKNVTLTEGRA